MSILKRLRIEAEKTQEELASMVGVSTSVYQRIEQDPEYASPRVLMKLCRILGTDMDRVLEPEVECRRPEIHNPYQALFARLGLLDSYLADYETGNEATANLVAMTRLSMSLARQKPNLGVMGRSDAGKSHFINTLLGSTALPAQLQPTTSAVTILRHIADKPQWQNEDVLIFKELVAIAKLNDEAFCTDPKRFYASGGIELLSSEIVHDHFDSSATEAYSCVVYVESDILNACNIVDSPGFANTDAEREEQSDTAKALSMLQMLDVLVYMSPITGCMDHTDMVSLRSVFKTLNMPEAANDKLPPLGNLFIVTSQAAPHISEKDLQGMIEKAARRVFSHFETPDGSGALEERGSKSGKGITETTLKARWYSFWSSTPERSDPLIGDLCHYLQSGIADTVKSSADGLVDRLKEEGSESLQSYLGAAENQIIKYEQLLEDSRLALEPVAIAKRFEEIEETRTELLAVVAEARNNALKESQENMQRILEQPKLEALIKDKYKDKKEAQEYAASLVTDRIQTAVEQAFKLHGTKVEASISERLEQCSAVMNKVELDKDSVSIPFDAKGYFTGGMIGAGMAAGLGIYASTMGALGGYAVVAQAVGILSSMGVGFAWSGGTAGIISGVATIGGPVVVTAALAAGVVLLGKRLFGDSWQRRLSKQLLKVFEEQQVTEKLLGSVDTAFDNLDSSVRDGCQGLKDGYHAYIAELQKLVENPVQSRADLAASVDQYRRDLAFFLGAPWAQA